MCGTPSETTSKSRWMKRLAAVVGLAAAGAIACALGACASHVQAFAPPKAPVTEISDPGYQALLDKYVGDNGKVDYARWKDDARAVAALDDYLSKLTSATPDTRPDLFASEPAKLSYWINLYNALVLREIIRRWPLDSVTDVRINATSFIKQGKGFFYDLKFVVGGKEKNLYDIENEIIRAQFKDARIHFAINCGSASCPLLRKDAFDPEKLETQLQEASTAFVNDGKNVMVDEGKKRVTLSKIFDWYAEDFVAFVKQRTNAKDATVLDFAMLYAKEPLASKLKSARAARYDVAFLDYDWNVNKQDATYVAKGPGVGSPIPDAEWKLLDGSTFRPSSVKGKVLLVDFWATFCKPCRQSFPRLQELYAKHEQDGLVIVGIAEDLEDDAIEPFLKSTGAKFSIAVDVDRKASGPPFLITSMPTELVVDRRGIVRHRHEGLKEGELDEIVREVEELLKEK